MTGTPNNGSPPDVVPSSNWPSTLLDRGNGSAAVVAATARDAPISALRRAVDALVAGDLEEVDEPSMHEELGELERIMSRLSSRQTRLVGQLEKRRSAAARAANPRDERAGERERRRVRDELAERFKWEPRKARRVSDSARRLEALPDTAAAFDRGALSADHVAVLTAVLKDVAPEMREQLEAELVRAAGDLDPVEFGKHCRRRLAETDHDAAMRQERHRYQRRSAGLSMGADGNLRGRFQLSGLDAETVATAVHAFRCPDAAGTPAAEQRAPDEITADALVELCRTAMRAKDAPSQHGAPPQIVVTIDYQTLLAGEGHAALEHVGSLPFGEVRHLLADAGVSRMLTDPSGLPLEVGTQVRTVPAGLWRLLRQRDGGCIAPGCRALVAWCDVMHLELAYADLGRLGPDNAALGCRHHHRRFDKGHMRVEWRDGRPTLHPVTRGTTATTSGAVATDPKARPRAGAGPGPASPSRGDPPGGDPPGRGPSSGDPLGGGSPPPRRATQPGLLDAEEPSFEVVRERQGVYRARPNRIVVDQGATSAWGSLGVR